MNAIDPAARHHVFEAGGVRYDEASRIVLVLGVRRTLEAKPLALLHALLVRAGGIATKRELIAAVWGNADHIGETSLTTAMSKLRAALGESGRDIIEVVHGSGYRIGVPVDVTTLHGRALLPFALDAGDRVPGRPQWRLEEALGTAPDRHVWRARHAKTGEARVFKFATSAAGLETLRREASFSRLLSATLGEHPGLARIAEWNFDHPPYFIESAYGGPSLAHPDMAARLAALSFAARVALAAAVSRIVAAAHEAGVLHGDIKPANILVATGTDGTLQPRLIDFGAGGLNWADRAPPLTATLAAPSAAANGPAVAEAGSAARHSFTLGYVAPEVLAGGVMTTGADIYALGILTYQLATADMVHLPGLGWQDAIVDPLLRHDIAAASTVDPAQRLKSAAGFAERLESLDTRRAAEAEAAADRRRAEAFAHQAERARLRRPWIVTAALCLMGALILSTVFAVRAGHDRDEARARGQTAQAVADFMSLDLLGRGNPAQSGKPDESLMAAAQAAEGGIARRLGHDPATAGALYLALARAFDSRSAYDAARHAYDQANAAFEVAGDPADATIARLHQVFMEAVCGQKGARARAASLLAAASPRLASLGARRPEAAIWLTAGRALLLMLDGDVAAAQTGFASAADAADGMPDRFDEDTRLSLRRRLAFTYVRLGQWGSAKAALDAVLARRLALSGPNHPETLQIELNLIEVLVGSGQAARAVTEIDRVQPAFTDVLGAGHRLSLDLLANRAQALVGLQRYDEALADQMSIYRAVVAKLGAGSIKAMSILTDAAQTQCRAGHLEAGLAAARTAYDALAAAIGQTGASTQAAAGNLAFCLIAGHDYAQARSYLDKVGAQALAQSGMDPDYAAQFGLMRAEVAFGLGDAANGRVWLARVGPAVNRAGGDGFLRRWFERLGANGTSDGTGPAKTWVVRAAPPRPPVEFQASPK